MDDPGGDPNEIHQLMMETIPKECAALKQSHESLSNVAAYCEENYLKSSNKQKALEDTKAYATQSLASVAYQLNVLATNFMSLLDQQTDQMMRMESSSLKNHKEKVARREVGNLTQAKLPPPDRQAWRQPEHPEPAQKFQRTPIDYSILDHIGHGVAEQGATRGEQLDRAFSTVSGQSSGGTELNIDASNLGYVDYMAHTLKKKGRDRQHESIITGGTLGRNTALNPNVYGVPVNKQPSGIAVATPAPPSEYQTRQYAMGGAAGGHVPLAPQQSLPNAAAAYQQPHQQFDAIPVAATMSMPPPQQHEIPNAPPPPSLGGPPLPPAAGHMSNLNGPGRSSSPPLPSPPPNAYAAPALQQQAHNHVSRMSSQQQQPLHDAQQQQQQMYDARVSMRQQQYEQERQQHLSQQAQIDTLRQSYNQAQPVPSQSAVPAAPPMSAAAPPPSRSSSHPAWAPMEYIEKVVALYDYTAEKEDELTITDQTVIYVIRKNDDGWYEGVVDPGTRGLFPGNYVSALN